jgi:hypothetical protein
MASVGFRCREGWSRVRPSHILLEDFSTPFAYRRMMGEASPTQRASLSSGITGKRADRKSLSTITHDLVTYSLLLRGSKQQASM